MPKEPISFEPLTREQHELYIQMVKRLHYLEFFINLKFMDNEEKREDFAKVFEEWNIRFYNICRQELDFDCSPLCPSEQAGCVPCEEQSDPYKTKHIL